jgi:hypothetical protein
VCPDCGRSGAYVRTAGVRVGEWHVDGRHPAAFTTLDCGPGAESFSHFFLSTHALFCIGARTHTERGG